MRVYGVFEWIFWVLAFGAGFLLLARVEMLSTANTQKVNHHAGQQLFLLILTVLFVLAGFTTAVIALRAGSV
jgi:hypothetical protein